MNKYLVLMLLLAAFSHNAYTQGCTPNPNPTPGPSCADAPFLCCGEVNGLSGTLPVGPNVNGPSPLCPNTSTVANNIEWVSFAAGTTSVTLNLNITNCVAGGGGNGVQVGVYSDCNWSNNIFCNGGQNMGNMTIVLSPLVIGEVYHLFIDGFSGAVCDYSFTVTDGNTFAPEPQSPVAITGLTSLCPDAPAQTYTAGLGLNSSFNAWSVTPGDVSFNDNGSSITVTDWGSAVGGTATICAEGLNDCYQNPTGLNAACITVTINEDQMDVASGSYCVEEGGYVFPLNGLSYSAGVYDVPIDNPSAGLGCKIIYELTVEEFVPVDLDSFIFLCPGEAYFVNGTAYTAPLNGLPVPFGVDDNFCNRFLNLSLAAIDTSNYIQADPNTVLSCDNPNILLTAIVPNFDPQVSYTYEWETTDGFFVNTNGQIAVVNQPGIYTVQITMEAIDDRGLVSCVATLSQIEITADTSGPSLNSTSETPSSCGTTLDGTATVNPTGGATPYNYQWDPAANNQTTPTATGLAPGVYSITVTDANMCDNITTVEVFGTPVVEIDNSPVIQNINCINELTGEITVSATGGTGTINYQWDTNANSQTGPMASGLGAGTFWVTATDALGCQDILEVTLTEPASAISGTIDMVTASACGQATGTISITPSGGTGPYDFMWSDATINEDLTSAPAGSYEVTITDDLGCQIVLSESIPNADGPSITAIDITNVDCNGNSTGELDLIISGGATPYTIDWDNAPDIQNPTGLAEGTYNVLVTDFNNCTVSGTATITEPDVLTASVNATQSNCSQSTGSLQLTVTGGSAISTYDWDNAPDVEDPDGLPEGTYNVIVTDVNGCVANASGTITEPDAPVGTSDFTNVSCNGADDGSVSINITSGGGGYLYDWGDASLNNNASNGSLAPGIYDIIVTDANFCTAVFQEEVEEPTLITADITPASTLCFGQPTGSAIAVPSGGVGPTYEYQWCSGESTDNAVALLSGPCAVTITDATGCEQIFNTTIPEAPLFEVLLDSITSLQCNDDGTGAIAISTNGGTGTFDYDWSGGPIPNNVEDPSGLSAGFYSVVITDGNDCITTLTNLEVEEPAVINLSGTTEDATCNLPNGSINVVVMGGTGNIDYNWTPALPNSPDHVETLAAGTYSVEITDDNGCQDNESFVVDEPDALAVAATDGSTVDCFGDNDGTASVEINGGSGIGTYNYDWGSGYPNADNIDGLAAGVYTVIVTDGDDCTIDADVTVLEPDALTIDLIDAIDPACQVEDGAINIDVGGGTITSDYTFDWNSGQYNVQNISNLAEGTYAVVVTDDNDCILGASYDIDAPETFIPAESSNDVTCNNLGNGIINVSNTNGSGDFSYDWSDTSIGDTPDATGLDPGFYDVVITDNVTGCIEEILQIEITEPTAIDVTASNVVDASCLNNDGSIDINISGGAGGFVFDWNGPGVVNGNSEDLNNLESGDYTLDVLDANDCPSQILVNISIPTAPTLSSIETDVLCNAGATGTIQLTANNPNGNVVYSWSDPSIGNTDLATGLSQGTYDVVVTDDENCTAELIAIQVNEPTAIQLSTITLETDCDVDNGSIDLTIDGGVGGYYFDWLDIADVEDPGGLGIGTYFVTVFDANDCPAETSATITQPTAPTATALTATVSCFNGNNGSINLDVVGDNQPYNFTWTGTNQSIEDPIDLTAGMYSVIVSDDDGCTTAVNDIEVEQPDELQITFTTDDATCNLPNGTINVDVTGGTGQIDYTWTPSLPNQAVHAGTVASGDYQLLINDENDCPATESITVDEPDPLTVDAENGSLLLCFGGTDGTASVDISGGSGVGTYSYDWGPNYPDVPSISNLAAGSYPVVITDTDDCIINAQVMVTEPTPVEITLDDFTDPSCLNPDGTINISVSGGTVAADYNYNWNNGTYSTQDISSLGSGTYNITVLDDNGCPAQESFSIQAPGSFTPDQVNTDISCNGENDGTISISTVDGSGDFSFEWSDPSIGDVQNATDLPPGFYDVLITDNQTGCENTLFAIQIEEPELINISATTVDPTCLNNNGEIYSQVDGGTGMLNYSWSGPGLTNQSDPIITNLEEGTYQLNILDQNGCPQVESFDIEMPTSPTLSAVPTDALCNGGFTGAIQTTATDPNGNLVYSWSDAAIGNTNLAEDLYAGTYAVFVTDGLDCTAEVLNITVGEPAPIDVQYMTTESNCDVDDGTIDLMPSGGVGGFTYDWEDLPDTQNQTTVGPGNFTVTVYDGNDCPFELTVPVSQPQAATVTYVATNVSCFNQATGSIDLTVVGSNGPYTFTWTGTNQTIEDPTDLPAGMYAVVVSDDDGCDTPIAGIEIVEGTEITATSVITPAVCGDDVGAIVLTVDGGTQPYTYNWADPNIGDINDPSLLANGNYLVTVIDALGCEFENAYAVNDPSGVQLQQTQQDVLCNGESNGSAIVDIQSGIDPITVEWTSSALPNIPDGLVATDLPAGLYTAVVTDGNDCITNLNFNISEPDALSAATQTSQSISCFGMSNGGAVAQVIGGTAPYDYLWNTNEVSDEILGLSAGIEYTVTITDDNDCEFIVPALVLGQPDELILSETVTDLICNGGDDAAIALQVVGGNSGFDYDWNDDQYDGSANITGITAGTYTVTVTDVENCMDDLTIIIDDPAGMDVMVSDVSTYDGFNVTCFGSEDGFINISTSGGTGNISYVWDDVNATQGPLLSDIGEGTYTAIITDENDCSTTFTESLNQPEEIQMEIDANDVNCVGDANGVVIVTNTNGGAGPYLYGIDQGPLTSNSIVSGLTPGQYSIMAEDANGCLVQQNFEINEPDSLLVDLGDDQEIAYGDSTSISTSIQIGGAPLASLTWDNETILCPDGNCLSINVKPEVTTTYRVTIVDENGCEHEDFVMVRVRKDRNVYIPNAFNPNSESGNNFFQLHTGRGVTMIEEFIVVDRWGEIMYRLNEAFDPNSGILNWGWDGNLKGQAMNPGVYVYFAKVRFLDDEVLEYAGDITLIK